VNRLARISNSSAAALRNRRMMFFMQTYTSEAVEVSQKGAGGWD